jgi:hypothetical protein
MLLVNPFYIVIEGEPKKGLRTFTAGPYCIEFGFERFEKARRKRANISN